MVGVIGFEPTAPSSQNWCANQAALHPEQPIRDTNFSVVYDFIQDGIEKKLILKARYPIKIIYET